MSAEKHNTEHANTTEHAEQPANHEAVLTGVIALASLFSNCVEAFGLIHPGGKWEKQEQLLLATLGVQQARLLIWGDVVGISSPPASVTDRAVPKHPSAAYPDLKEPTFFAPRDPRLDASETRQQVENAISAIVDRSAGTSREEMMEKYGLKAPKKSTHEHQPALDTNRLEAFRERYELLKEVAETYARINTRRQSSIVSSSWTISDFTKFRGFIKLTQEKIDFLITFMDVKERVDRGMRMDIRALGWHLTADRARVALDETKLRLIREACQDEYPEYIEATKEALENIERERQENVTDYNPYTPIQFAPFADTARHFAPVPFQRSGRGSISAASGAYGAINGATPGKEKRTSIFGSLFKRKSTTHVDKDRSLSVATERPSEPLRSLSDTGPARPGSHESERASETTPEPVRESIRSKSVGDILDVEEETRTKLEQMKTDGDIPVVAVDPPPEQSGNLNLTISSHDQYHGLGRQGTKTQW